PSRSGVLLDRRGVSAHRPEAARAAVLGEPVPLPEPRQEPVRQPGVSAARDRADHAGKHLLYTEKYTIEGARQKIEQYRRSGDLKPEARRALATQTVKDLRAELKSILAILEGNASPNAGAR